VSEWSRGAIFAAYPAVLKGFIIALAVFLTGRSGFPGDKAVWSCLTLSSWQQNFNHAEGEVCARLADREPFGHYIVLALQFINC
jgi:hypothetical protein